MQLILNEKAPDFELENESNCSVSLSDYHGMWVLLYFYPKDDTPGCTKQAEIFRDMFEEFEAKDVVLLGISGDSVESHEKFKKKFGLPFMLLADEDKEVCALYNSLDEENERAKRKSFLVDPDGNLAKIYNNVIPEEHAQEVLADLEELQAL